MTATAFRDLSAILNKAGSPAAGALVVPNGKKGAALDPQVTAQALSAIRGVLTHDEWTTLMPVFSKHCPTQAQAEPEQDEPEAQAEQTQPEHLPDLPEEVRVDVEDSDFMPPADEAVASLNPEPETKPDPEPEQDVQSCIDEDGDFIPD